MRTRTRTLIAPFGIALGLVLFAAPAMAETAPKYANEATKQCAEKLAAGGGLNDAGCLEAPNPLLPAANEMLWGTAAFLVLLVAMWKWGVPAVKNMEQAREDRIRDDLEAASKAKADADGALTEYRGQIANAQAEASGIIDAARQQAEVVKRALITRAEQEAADVRTKANEDVRLATERAFADLRQRVGSMSVELASKIVERNLDVATQQGLIDSYISSVGSN